MERRIGLQRNASDIRIQFLQPPRRAYERAAGSKDGNEVRDPSLGLLPNFVRRAMVMSLPVGVVGILVGIVIEVRMLGVEFARHADRTIGAFARIGVKNVRAVSV